MVHLVQTFLGEKKFIKKTVPMTTKLEGRGGGKALVVGPLKHMIFAASLTQSEFEPTDSKWVVKLATHHAISSMQDIG